MVALAVTLADQRLATGQESPSPRPRTTIDQATTAPTASAPPMEPTVEGTFPAESPAPSGTVTVIPSPDPSTTVTPTETLTLPSATATPSPTPPVTVTVTVPTVAPTLPPAVPPPADPGVVLPGGGDGIIPVDPLISLSDRFDDPAGRLLGETRASDERITGRYEDGRYRLEIDGPEVAPDLIAVVRSPNLIDVTIGVTAQLEGITRDRYVMATCREVESYGGYRAYLNPDEGYFAITRFEPGGYPTELQHGFADGLILGNDPFEFAFSCVGFVLELRVNGETIGIAADNAFAAGSVNIGTGYFGNAEPGPVSALFEDLTVTGSVSSAASTVGQRHANLPADPVRDGLTVPVARWEQRGD